MNSGRFKPKVGVSNVNMKPMPVPILLYQLVPFSHGWE